MQLRNIEQWLERLAHSRHALTWLFFISLAETIILPIPIELLMIPYMAINRHLIWRTAWVVLAGCLLGALVGYGFGYLFFETAGEWLISNFGWERAYAAFEADFADYGFWAILAVGTTPIPFQTAMIAAGASGYPVYLFLLAAFIARGTRYFGIALLVYWFGERVLRIWAKDYRRVITIAVAAAILVLALSYAVSATLN